MVAEFKSDLSRARTREGMQAAKAEGRQTNAEIFELFNDARSTVYRIVKRIPEPQTTAK